MWIRSQNKEILANVDILYVEEGKEYSDLKDGYDIVDDEHRYGRYETKERALEVLDEIEKYINSDIMMNLDIYEMPKEQ